MLNLIGGFYAAGAGSVSLGNRDITGLPSNRVAREAFKRGYKTTIVSDAVSSYLPDLHAAVLKNFGLKFGWVSTARELMAALARAH